MTGSERGRRDGPGPPFRSVESDVLPGRAHRTWPESSPAPAFLDRVILRDWIADGIVVRVAAGNDASEHAAEPTEPASEGGPIGPIVRAAPVTTK